MAREGLLSNNQAPSQLDPTITALPFGGGAGSLCRPAGPSHDSFRGCCRGFVGTLGLFGVAAIRLMPMTSQLFAATLTTLLQPRRSLSLVC